MSVLVIESPKVRHREDSDQNTERNGEVMAVSEKGERAGVISNYDCEGKIASNGGPNARVFVMHRLKDKTQRR